MVLMHKNTTLTTSLDESGWKLINRIQHPVIDYLFGERDRVTKKEVLEFFEGRLVPENRINIEKVLGDKPYTVHNMIVATNGNNGDDYIWVKVKDTDLFEVNTLRGQLDSARRKS